MNNVIYPDFNPDRPVAPHWEQLQELLDDAFGYLLDEEDHEFSGDDILLAECLVLTGAVLRSTLSPSHADGFQQSYRVFLERLASAAWWSAGCCNDEAIRNCLWEISTLASAKTEH